MSDFRKFVSRTLGRGTRVKLAKSIEVSCPESDGIVRVTVPEGTCGTVLAVLPEFQIRLDSVHNDKIEVIQWHFSSKIYEDLVPLEDNKPKLWLVK